MTRARLALSVDLDVAAHEMRTPLAAIMAAAELLRDGVAAESPDVRRFADLLVRNAARLDRLIDDLILMARIEQDVDLVRRPISVEPLLDRVALAGQATLVQRDIELRVSCGSGPDIDGDGALLSDALLRVLDSAVEATATGGVVEITAGFAGADWRIDVADGATAPRELDRIFEPFAPAAGGGRRKDLRLPIAAAVVRRHNGSVSAHNGAGAGTTVTLVLPATVGSGVI